MHDALALGHERKKGCCAKLFDVGVQRGDLFFADGVGDALIAQLPAGGRGVVVGGGHNRAHPPDFAASLANAFKGLRAGDFMHQMTVNIQNSRAVFFGMDDVFVPNLVV